MALHVWGWAAFGVGALCLGYAMTVSLIINATAGLYMAAFASGHPARTVAYRFFLVIGLLAAGNGAWRLTHVWWAAPIGMIGIWFLMPRLYGPHVAMWLRSGAIVPERFLRVRWAYVLAGYVAFQVVDVIGSIDYRPFG